MKLAELSEAWLVFHFREPFPRGERTVIGIGDDYAQVVVPEGSLIVTTDVMVEDQHFHLSWPTGHEVGARVAVQNLVDIDAMRGRPSTLVTSVVAPRNMNLDAFLDVIRGLEDHACEVGAGVVDGDLSAGEKLVISITASGYCPGSVVRCDGARPGDAVVVSGTLGYSYAGLDLLEGGYIDPSPRGVEQLGELAPFIEMYRAPRPPLGSGVATAAAGACAMMGLSDGSATDAGHITQASGVAVESNRDATETEASQPTPAARVYVVDPVRWVLQGGEKHRMITVFSSDTLLPDGFRVVGEVRTCRPDEEPQAMMDGTVPRGAWDHFSADPVD